MAQINLYMDDEMLRRIRVAARREHKSISALVKKYLLMSFHSHWPEHYFDLFGSVSKEDLKRPPQEDFSKDVRRESL